jgi:hypothetical protein
MGLRTGPVHTELAEDNEIAAATTATEEFDN